MTATVFLAVLFAAGLHAAWNAAVKSSRDKLLGMTAIVLGHMIPSAVALLFVPFPSLESLPYMAAGVFFHFGYQLLLLNSYRVGDFTQVYPLARGTGPLVVALVSVTILSVELTVFEIAGVALVVLGIISLGLVRKTDGLRNPKAAFLAFGTGCFIAGYSIFDGLGARVANNPVGFISTLMLVNGVVFVIYLVLAKPGAVTETVKQQKSILLIGGFFSYIAYALVVWAFTQAPIALVTALRETSILFALGIGVFMFGERLDFAKLASTTLTLVGVVLVRYGKNLI